MRKVLPLKVVNAVVGFPFEAKDSVLGMAKSVGEKVLSSQTRERLVSLPGLKSLQKSNVRQFLHPELSLVDFFEELKNREVTYVVLRWFENLPDVKPGEDIDILIADEDLDKIADLFGRDRNQQKFDIYTVSGGNGHHLNNLPYYPPELSREILKNRQWHKKVFSVPDPRRYFLSLAYHAVFHKGSESGLPNSKHPEEKYEADHDYLAYLRELAKPAGFEGRSFAEFNELYRLLCKEGWSPEFDTLRKMAEEDPWLYELLPDSDYDHSEGEMLVFIVRQWAMDNGKLDTIQNIISDKGLEILKVKTLDREEQKRATNKIRGGKWDKGPFPQSGGPPSTILICFDYHPKSPDESTRETHPFVKNQNVMLKYTIRDYLNDEMFYFNHVNSIHSADNEVEAYEYLEHVMPDEVDDIRKQVEKRKKQYRTEFPVLHLYKSYRTRAKIEQIDYHGKKAVKKTFKAGFQRFLEHEAFACETFSQKLDTVPPLWEKGDNYVIIPWYENILEGLSKRKKRKLLKPHADQVIKSMQTFYREGYALIGFNPDNLILTPEHKIKLIDFEFLYRYKEKPESFLQSYDIAGIPDHFDGDLPRGLLGKGHTWNNTWKPVFGNVNLTDPAEPE